MMYRNKRTGAFIDTDSKLSGVWEEYIPSKEPEIIEEPKNNVELETRKTEEPKKQEVKGNDRSIDDVTVKDIKQELDAFGIKYNPKANKAELWKLMKESR